MTRAKRAFINSLPWVAAIFLANEIVFDWLIIGAIDAVSFVYKIPLYLLIGWCISYIMTYNKTQSNKVVDQ